MPAPFSQKVLPLLVLGQLLLAGILHAADVLERRISVHFQQTPLKNALEEVARLGQFEWSYPAGIIDGARPVTLSANNWTVRETLYTLLGDGFELKPNGIYIILKKRRRPPGELSGYVTDPRTGERLANATVYDRRSLRATTTDEDGFYQLKKSGRKTEIVVAKLGYRDTVLQISSTSPRFQKIDMQTIPANTARTQQPFLQTTYSKIEHFFSATIDQWSAVNVPDSLHRRFQISLLPYIGTNHRLSGKVANDVSINILAGHSRSVHGVEFAGLGNFTDEKVEGVQFGGLFNLLRGDNRGAQVAGLVNRTRDTLAGVQVAGLVNFARRSTAPAVQVAGLVNTAREGNTSLQIAGLANYADTLRGVQVAGLTNTTREGNSGIQVAGLVNHADTLHGVQVAGIANHARSMHGVQIGLVNSAGALEGLQIGLINRSGRRWLPILNW